MVHGGFSSTQGLIDATARKPPRRVRAGLFSALLAVACGAAAQELWTPEISIDITSPTESCPFDAGTARENPEPIFEYMKGGASQAVACANFLEAEAPGWQSSEGAQALVVPLVSFLLGDGTARGLQRHAIFIDLLGHLEKIAPDWRWRDEVRPLMRQIILASVVEDPFVANVWTTVLPEMDEQWRESDAARAVIAEIYTLAADQARRPPGPRNERPAALLKELSMWNYSRLILATRVFDTWPKRILWIMVALLAVAALVKRRMSR